MLYEWQWKQINKQWPHTMIEMNDSPESKNSLDCDHTLWRASCCYKSTHVLVYKYCMVLKHVGQEFRRKQIRNHQLILNRCQLKSQPKETCRLYVKPTKQMQFRQWFTLGTTWYLTSIQKQRKTNFKITKINGHVKSLKPSHSNIK